MDKKTRVYTCPHTRNHLCEACKELGFEGNRSVAFMRTDNDFHKHNTRFHVRIERNIALIFQLKTITLAPTTTLSRSYESIQRTKKTSKSLCSWLFFHPSSLFLEPSFASSPHPTTLGLCFPYLKTWPLQ